MLNKKNRIGDRRLIEFLFKEGEVYRDSLLVFKYKKLPDLSQKFAVSVGKKLSKKASQRNRIRRQIYESIRLEKSQFDKGLIAFVIARPSALDTKTNFNSFRKSVQSFFDFLSRKN